MRSLLFFVSALVLLSIAPDAVAQEQPAGPSGDEGSLTPPYIAKVQNGLRLAASRDFEGSVAALQDAVQLSPTEPQAHYYLGEVRRIQGNPAGALESFRAAQRMAQETRAPAWQARAMQAVAETLERQENQLEAARQAWTEYARFADANRGASSPEIARARIEAIDRAVEQERAYVAVRQRIAEREAENAAASE